jgi:uncharacterized protein
MNVRYLILALTTRCNLCCRYCYNGPEKTPADMPESVLYQACRLAADSGLPFHLQLTGGEPTLVPALIEKAARSARESGLCRTIGIQTNGSCLSPEMLKLFKIYDMQVGVSLDGGPDVHQAQRGKAAETLRGLQMLESAGIPFRVTTVVTRHNTAFLDRLVLTLAGFSCARGIGLDLLVAKGRAAAMAAADFPDSRSLADGSKAMAATLAAVNARRPRPIRLREKDLLMRAEKKPAFCHACRGESLAVHPDGRLFPCGQTLADDSFAAGTVWHPEPGALQRLGMSRPEQADCERCEIRDRCPGDCPGRLHYNRGECQALVCSLYRALWERSTENPPERRKT